MNIHFIHSALVGLLLLGISCVSNSAIISGTQVTKDGKTVDLQGLEWMSLEYTAGLSRSEVEGGFTDTYGTIWSASEWRYATRAETGVLLNSLWGGVYEFWATNNGDGARWFIEHFMGLAFDTGAGNSRVDGTQSNTLWSNYDWSDFFFGENGECSSDLTDSCLGTVGWMSRYGQDLKSYNVLTSKIELAHLSGEAMGWIGDSTGAEFNWTTTNQTLKISDSDLTIGSLLVRKATVVSEPSVITIFTFALIGLVIRRRRATYMDCH
jgi:hypothetical protein